MDAPIKLVDTVLKDLKYYYDTASEKVDAVLIAGDFVVHGLSNSDPNFRNWPEMKKVFQAVIASVEKQFPGVPIIPTIGNNDLLNHYQAPKNESEKALFYGDLYDIWFDKVSGNSKQPFINTIKDTFMDGGFYRYDLNSDVSVLSINSILMN